jgi:hypothetical protein
MNAAAAKPRLVDPVAAFRLRCEARAMLYGAGELDLHEAVDVLQLDAERDGLVGMIGQDAVQEVMAQAFRPYREAQS